LYQTTVVLILAYVILFFPVALGAIRSVLLQINPRLEDAAHGMSHNYFSVLFRINVPLMKPGLIMGFAMVFLLVMKELPVTLILGPLGFKTLATEVWSFSSEAFFASAAVPALIIILICSLPMLVIIIWDKRIGD
jgi:iron(III) transport system permease protein